MGKPTHIVGEVIQTIGDFTINAAELYYEDADIYQVGYAVVYTKDGVTQNWCNNKSLAVQYIMQHIQVFALLDAYLEQIKSSPVSDAEVFSLFDDEDDVTQH